MKTNLEWAYNEQYTVCYVCILVPTNNMIAFFPKKYYSEADVAFVELTLDSFGIM